MALFARSFSTLLAIILLYVLSFICFRRLLTRQSYPTFQPDSSNTTLGFGTILVVAQDPTTWRAQGLLQASSAIGLQLDIPLLKIATEESIHTYSSVAGLGRNYVASLLSHQTVLERSDRLSSSCSSNLQAKALYLGFFRPSTTQPSYWKTTSTST